MAQLVHAAASVAPGAAARQDARPERRRVVQGVAAAPRVGGGRGNEARYGRRGLCQHPLKLDAATGGKSEDAAMG